MDKSYWPSHRILPGISVLVCVIDTLSPPKPLARSHFPEKSTTYPSLASLAGSSCKPGARCGSGTNHPPRLKPHASRDMSLQTSNGGKRGGGGEEPPPSPGREGAFRTTQASLCKDARAWARFATGRAELVCFARTPMTTASSPGHSIRSCLPYMRWALTCDRQM